MIEVIKKNIMSSCVIICFALAIPTKEINMDIINIKRINLYEVPYGDKVMLLSHEEFEKYGVGGKDELLRKKSSSNFLM